MAGPDHQEDGAKAVDQTDRSSNLNETVSHLLPASAEQELAALIDIDELKACFPGPGQGRQFDDEKQYWRYLHVRFSLLSMQQNVKDTLAARMTGHGTGSGTMVEIASEELLSQLTLFKRLSDVVTASGERRLQKNKQWRPRLERLADKYRFEGAERELFRCAYVLQAMPALPMSGARGSLSPSHFLRVVGMSEFEYEALMDKERQHIKDGLLIGSDAWHGRSAQSLGTLVFTKEALQMLVRGKDIGSAAALTLSTTKMMEVLEEEGFGKELGAVNEDKPESSRVEGADKKSSTPLQALQELHMLVKEELGEDAHLMDEDDETSPHEVPSSERPAGDAAVDPKKVAVHDATGPSKDTAGKSIEKDLTDVLAELRSLPPGLVANPEGLRRKRKADGDEDQADPVDSADKEKEKNEGPYRTNLEYLEDRFQLLALQIQLSRKKSSKHIQEAIGRSTEYMEDYLYSRSQGGQGSERRTREMEAKQRMVAARIQKRLESTRKEGKGWKPRLLALSEKLGLDGFEEAVVALLIGNTVSPVLKTLVLESRASGELLDSGMIVNQILTVFCETFEEQVTRRVYFYKGAKLVQSGVLKLGELSRGWGGDLVSTLVEVDRRTLDFVVGLDTELNELVEGSHLYTPQVSLEKVVLPAEQKELVLKTISSFEFYAEKRAEVGLEDTIHYGAGLVVLFCGPSGTGKTMTVNALANHLHKRVLLVNLPSLGPSSGDMNFKWLFREAKVNDAVLFFDECESVFESREKGSKQVNILLTEMERHKGIVFLATNRPYDLDEAMHRRITLVVEFHAPDHLLRVDIWKKLLPPKLPLAPGVNFKKIGLKYELTGGFIKNAIISSLLLAIGRDKKDPLVTEADLMEGCKMQLRGSLRMKSFDRRIVPKAGLDALVVSADLEERLQEIAHLDKARQILFGQWGFSEQMRERQGISALFHGPPGTGKTMAAECLGFEMGKPLKFVNCGELVNKYVGETGKNIDKVFEEGKMLDAMLVFDEAEGLFGSRHAGDGSAAARYANVDVGILLHHLERFPGVVILITNTIDGIDKAFFRRIKFVLKFEEPDAKLRARLWRSMIPEKVPIEGSIDYDRLAQRFEYSGGSIASAVFRAAARAALREGADMKLKMEDLVLAGEEENQKSGATSSSHKTMFL